MRNFDLETAARDAVAVLHEASQNVGGGADSLYEQPLHALRRALRGPDDAGVLMGAATVLCMLQPGHGSGDYRGDPVEAVALQQRAATMREDAKQETARRIVESDVLVCLSSAISSLMGATDSSGDQLLDDDEQAGLAGRDPDDDDYREALDGSTYACAEGIDPSDGATAWRWWTRDADEENDGAPAPEDSDWFETEGEALRDLFETEGLDQPDGSEAFEHWAVTRWLGEKLEAMGESVVQVGALGMLNVWARCTTGQAICIAWTFQRIAEEINEVDASRIPSPGDLDQAAAAMRLVAATEAAVYPAPSLDQARRDRAGECLAALRASRTGYYAPAVPVFAVACEALHGFDPRDLEA